MKRHTEVTFPELGLIAATRGILGAGIGLLLADQLSDSQRRAVGWTMLSIGALSTIPLAIEVLGRRSSESSAEEHGSAGNEECFEPAHTWQHGEPART
jgi:hypothetical protein